jgi:TPR repeat protein
MGLRCLACGAENPATNLYCGHCGTNLHRTAMDTLEQGRPQREGETDADARASEEAERRRRTEIARGKEIELESLGIFMPWNLPAPASDPAQNAASARSTAEAAAEPRAKQPPVRNIAAGGVRASAQNIVPTSITSVPRPASPAMAQHHSTRWHAHKSHSLRNLTLAAIVGTAAILAVFEWSFIRDTIVPYVENEVRQARRQYLPAAAPPALAADNASPAPGTAADLPDARSVHGVPGSSASVAPGAADMYQAAHAGNARLRAAWLWKAVRAGNPRASVELAKMYEVGDGVAQSCVQARLLLRAAAAKGNAQAKLGLRQLQRRGCSEP